MPKRAGRKSKAQTPAPRKERIYGSKKNPKGSAASEKSASKIKLDDKTMTALKNKLKEFKEKHPKKKNITLNDLKAVYRRGAGAYSKSHRPTITGGAPNSRNAWSMARVNKFLLKAGGTKVKAAYVQDDDLMKMAKGGEILGIKYTISKGESDDERIVTFEEGQYRDIQIEPHDAIFQKTWGRMGGEGWAHIKEFGFTYPTIREAIKSYLEDKRGKKYPIVTKKKGGITLLAPNGEPSNLTPEQYKLVRTPQFKEWFGDWENDPKNSSKVVDENGEPLVVYHGSDYVFNVFKTDKQIYFATNKEYASEISESGRVKSFFINIRNLLDATKFYIDDYSHREYKTFLKKNGIDVKIISRDNEIVSKFWYLISNSSIWKSIKEKYDGFSMYENMFATKGKIEEEDFDDPFTKVYVCFESNQIKLADGSNITFDVSNPDIRYAKGGLIAPNGKPSNLTPEQYKLVRTPKFKKWFGDWENDPQNASKVVDENGEPKVVYHGSRSNFSIFDINKSGESSTGAKVGFWFTPIKKFAYNFAQTIWYGASSDIIVYPLFLSIKNPKIYTSDIDSNVRYPDSYQKFKIDIWALDGQNADKANIGGIGMALNNQKETIKKYREFLENDGFDGIFIKNTRFDRNEAGGLNDQIVALFPNQIKLADGSNTTFYSHSDDIRFAKGGEINELSGKITRYEDGSAWVDLYDKKGNAVGDLDISYDTIENLLYSPYESQISKKEYYSNPQYKNLINQLKIYGLKPTDKVHYLEEIYIDDNHRGKGYASAAVNQLISFYKSKGDKYLLLTVGDYQQKNGLTPKQIIEFYSRHGFKLLKGTGNYQRRMIIDLQNKFAKGGDVDEVITCKNCGWSWNESQTTPSEKYICHKCGFDNEPNDDYAKGGQTFNDKELLAKWKRGESIGFTATAHLKAKGLIPRSDGTKRKSPQYKKEGGLVGGFEDLTDEWLSKKIEIFLNKVKPIKFYFVDPNTNTLTIGFDKYYSQDAAQKVYEEATSSKEFFHAPSVESTYDSKTGDLIFKIKLKKSVEYSKGGNIVYSAIFFDEDEIVKRYGRVHPNLYSHHSTIEFKPQSIGNLPIGDRVKISIVGRLTTDKVDVLLVNNPLSKNKYPHITLSTSEGVKPFESNKEIEQNIDKVEPLNDYLEGVVGYFDGSGDITNYFDKGGDIEFEYLREAEREEVEDFFDGEPNEIARWTEGKGRGITPHAIYNLGTVYLLQRDDYGFDTYESTKYYFVSINESFAKGGEVNQYFRAEVGDDFQKQKTFIPNGYYEMVGKDGNPVIKYDEYAVSNVPEVAASKTIYGAILGASSMLKFGKGITKNTPIQIYTIQEKPDVDISHWGGADFEYLDEVRYRKNVLGKYLLEYRLDDDAYKLVKDFYDYKAFESESKYDDQLEFDDSLDYIYEMISNGTFFQKFKKLIDKSLSKKTYLKGGEVDENIIKERWAKKKDSLMNMADNIRSLRTNLRKDLKGDDDKDRLTALAISLMDKTAERVGNNESEANGHLGITGLSKRNVKVEGNTITLKYIGKSGVKQEKQFSDEGIASALKDAIANSQSKYVFETSDGFRIKNDRINRYLNEYDISAKDLRGYSANQWIVSKLREVKDKEILGDEAKRKKKFNEIVKSVAEKVGHGAPTLKKHYMLPSLEREWVNNGKIVDLANIKRAFEDGGEINYARGGSPRIRMSEANEIKEYIKKQHEQGKSASWGGGNRGYQYVARPDGVFLSYDIVRNKYKFFYDIDSFVRALYRLQVRGYKKGGDVGVADINQGANVVNNIDYDPLDETQDIPNDGEGIFKDGGEIDLGEAKRLYSIAYGGYDGERLSQSQKRSQSMKSHYAQRKLKKLIGFDIGDLPSHTHEQKKIREQILNYSEMKKGGELKFNDVVLFHEEQGNWLVPKNTIYAWLYDDPKASEKIESGEYDYILFPPSGGIGLFSQKGYVPPLLKVWTKKYQDKTKGANKLIGIVRGWYDEDNKKLYIDMMTTRKDMRRKGVNSHIIKNLREEFKLDKDQIIFDKPTKEGEMFSKSGKYEDGGDIYLLDVNENIQYAKGGNVPTIEVEKIDKDSLLFEYDNKGHLILERLPYSSFNVGDYADKEGLIKELKKYGIDKGEKVWSIKIVQVKPRYRGQGVASTLLSAAIQWAKENDYEKLVLVVQAQVGGALSNEQLYELYSKFKFKPLRKTYGVNWMARKLDNGGEVDLFEHYDELPQKVQAILEKYENEEPDYTTLESLQGELEEHGYTFDYGLDYEPYNLRKMAKGGEISDEDKKETYKKWKSLVNMSKSELEKFYNSEEGKVAGLTASQAKSQGIDSGRESARWIMKMKDTSVKNWTPTMWKWAKKQISFISRMSGNKGKLYDESGAKTRKHTSLLIWGHNPTKKAGGGELDIPIKENAMNEVTYNQLPAINDLGVGKKFVLKEHYYNNHNGKPTHQGCRYLIVENMGDAQMSDCLKLKVHHCYGGGGVTTMGIITRPIKNIMNKGRDMGESLSSGVEKAFKKGGELDPDKKEVKQYFEHKSGAAGGLLVGKRHSEGGIQAINKSTGQPLEMEGGEVVITRDAVSDSTLHDFNGKQMTNREILSAINESGGGVKFAEGGDVSCKCSGKEYKLGGKTYKDYELFKKINNSYGSKPAIEKGMKVEDKEHGETFRMLKNGEITYEQFLKKLVVDHLSENPKYYDK